MGKTVWTMYLARVSLSSLRAPTLKDVVCYRTEDSDLYLVFKKLDQSLYVRLSIYFPHILLIRDVTPRDATAISPLIEPVHLFRGMTGCVPPFTLLIQ